MEEHTLLVLADPSPPHRLALTLMRIPLTRVEAARFDHADLRYSFWAYLAKDDPGPESGKPLETTGAYLAANQATRDNLRLLSRYPQGVSGDLLTRLEAVYGEIETLEPGGAR